MSLKNHEIPNLYKPDYIGERYADNLCKKLVSLSKDNLAYKVVFGNRDNMVMDCQDHERQKKTFDEIQRKIKFNEVVRRHEIFFNEKLKKYKNDYINELVNLLYKNGKNYSRKRKKLTLKNEEMKLPGKSKISVKINVINKFKRNNKSTLNLDTFEKSKKKKNEILNLNTPLLQDNDKEIRIIETKDDEYALNDSNIFYSSERIFERLEKSNPFFSSSKDDKTLKIITKKVVRDLEFPKPSTEINKISRNREKTLAKIKRSTSYEVRPLNTYNKNISVNINKDKNHWRSLSRQTLLSKTSSPYNSYFKSILTPNKYSYKSLFARK